MKFTHAVLFSLFTLVSSFNASGEGHKKTVYDQEAMERVLDLENIKVAKEKVAYCYEIICCKTTTSGSKVCKTSCGTCPIGWLPEY